MLNALCNKMTRCMLWALIVPCAILILMLSWLIGSYASVVWKSDQVSYEGSLGKFSAKTSNLQEQLQKALATNEQLTKTVVQLRKSLDDLKISCTTSSQLKFSNEKVNLISDKFMDLFKSLDNQSNLLAKQKEKLEAVNDDILQFKHELKEQSEKHIKK